MPLYAFKACRIEHNLAKQGSKIQLGTFQHYRELDPEFSIADIDEGFCKLTFRTPDRPVELGQSLIEGALLDGDIHLKKVKLKKLRAGRYEVGPNSEIAVRYPFINSYIFSASRTNINPSIIAPEYNSSYHIDDLASFGELCVDLLNRVPIFRIMAREDVPNTSIANFRLPLQWHVVIAHVTYEDSSEIMIESEDDFTPDAIQGHYMKALSTKRTSFKHEDEVRIIFLLHHPVVGVLKVKQEPLVLNANIASGHVSGAK